MERLMGFFMLMGSILGEDVGWMVDDIVDDELLIQELNILFVTQSFLSNG
jgi:hypothetical protein